MASTSQSQPNGVSSSAPGPSQSASQPTQNTTTSGSATVQNTQATGASSGTAGSSNTAQAGVPGAPQPPASPAPTHAPRPRDARTIELLLTSQGVTSFDQRVPLLLLDFAYRHTSSVLSDAIHLSTDPYTSHAGAKPSASSGAAPSAPSTHDAVITTSAINTAIASRQAFQFRGGAGGVVGGGGASKDWLQELARERNKVALPRIPANEWGMRLPNERFVLSGTGWGLRDEWGGDGGEDEEEDSDEDMEIGDASQKKDAANATTGEGAPEEGGGLDELLGDDMVDEDMEGME
ncbi:TFIID-31kDa-domain-containing protein [Hypomontagnella monticulosa]|nr:TFIID-31kDa-domain-containing protein [Hypomontagnella monticulosa]